MNKIAWKICKYVLAVFVVYTFVLQASYLLISGSLRGFAFESISSEGRPEVKYTSEKIHNYISASTRRVNIFAKHLQARQSTNVSSTDEAGETLVNSPEHLVNSEQLLYDDGLLRKPQQKFNYYHPNSSHLWPNPTHLGGDRILPQLKYGQAKSSVHMKRILVYTGLKDRIQSGQETLLKMKCPINQCELTSDRSSMSTADAVLWQNHIVPTHQPRPMGQIWVLFLLESPYHTPSLKRYDGQFNWTATYRSDSTIVAPYERFTLFNSSVDQLPLTKNYAAGKTKKIAWFVSNCGTRNNRLGYAKELNKYMQVDIYGVCGEFSCPRSQADICFTKLKSYKFYLSFENSNCRDYITEKFFVNGLQNDLIPIVMGAHPDDYRKSAPINSYIHVDDFESPQKLAEYLTELDNDDDKYNDYFRWKGSGYNINTYFWCRLCAMVHAADHTKPFVYQDLEEWWRGPQICHDLDEGQLWPKWS